MEMKGIMYKRNIVTMVMFVFTFGMVSCLDSDSDSPEPQFDFGIFYSFQDSISGWQAGISDIPEDTLDDITFDFVRDTIEEITGRDNIGIKVSSNNPHKDVFVFVAKQLDSLSPNTDYLLDFDVEFKVNLETDTSGQFDKELYFKAGVAQVEPDTMFVEADSELGYNGYALNLDKGNNEHDGRDLKTLSNMDVPEDRASPYIASASGTGLDLTATSDNEGKLWVILGIDSNIPFTMSYSFNTINIYLKEQ